MGASVGPGVAGGAGVAGVGVSAEGVAGSGVGVATGNDSVEILKETLASPIWTFSESNSSTSTQQSLGDANGAC